MLLWLEDGQYCFDEEERGKVVKGGIIASGVGRVDAEGDGQLHGLDLAP